MSRSWLFDFEDGRCGGACGSFHSQRTGGGTHFAARFFAVVNAARNDVALGAIKHGGFLGDGAFLVSLQTGIVEGAPAERVTRLDDFVKRFAFTFAQT